MFEKKKCLWKGGFLLFFLVCIVLLVPNVFKEFFEYIIFSSNERSGGFNSSAIVLKDIPDSESKGVSSLNINVNHDMLDELRHDHFHAKLWESGYSIGLDEQGFFKVWVLRVEVFEDYQLAKQLEDKLLTAGYPAYVRVEYGHRHGELYIVLVGPEIKIGDLRSWQRILRENLGIRAVLMRYVV